MAWRILLTALLALSVMVSTPAAAQDLLVLQLADDPEGQALEQAWILELSLALLDHAAVLSPVDAVRFKTWSLGAQVDQVRPLLAAGDAVAVAWLDASQPERIDVTLVFVSDDRAVARLLQAERAVEPLAELALGVQEVLSVGPQLPAAPLVPEPVPEPRGVAGQTGPPAPPVGSSQEVILGAAGEWDPPGVPGASGRLGAQVRVERALAAGPRLRLDAALSGQLGVPTTGAQGRAWSAALVPAVGAQLWRGPVGLRLALEVPVHRVVVEDQISWGAKVRAGPSVAVSWRTLRLEAGVGVALLRHQVVDLGSDQVVWDSGWLDVVTLLAWVPGS
jgi:hypothetical protein